MAGPQKPALTGVTKPNNMGGATDVQTNVAREVTYIFQCTTAASVNLPYAVAVNGKVIASHEKKVSRVNSGVVKKKGKTIYTEGKFTVDAEAGDKVSLYLNSDAAVGYRNTPVYAVTVGERDIIVKITEKEGRFPDSDAPTPVAKPKDATAAPTADESKAAPAVDEYTAPLTGDIWMKVSHKYTAAEVDAGMPTGTSAEVIAAIKDIYSGLTSATLTVSVPATAQQAAKSLKVTFSDSNNPKANIVSYSLLKDGLTRVHPGGFAALLNSALENDIPSLQVTSCWRPMLGSIAHRVGLGLDVGYVGLTRMNRQELRSAFEGKKPSKSGNGDDTDNVSDAEVTKFAEYESAIIEAKTARADLSAAEKALKAAKKTKDSAKTADAQTQVNAASKALEDADIAEDKAREAWNDERNATEPATVRLFRTSLLKCSCVRQLFDPWVMDENTQDTIAPAPNMQRGADFSNERLHSHHLHITVHEPKIL